MTEKINWRPDFKIGIEDIDLQHEYFAMLINRLMDKLADSDDDFYSCRLLEELSHYASFHFISEENMMLHCNYPRIEIHKELHRKLMNQLNDKINYFRMSKVTEDTIVEFLIEWFTNHTVESDQKFGDYFNRTNQHGK